jgi:hypothetical protein
MRIDKTSRRVGFQKLQMPMAAKPKLIKAPAFPTVKAPKAPKVPAYGKFPRGHVY